MKSTFVEKFSQFIFWNKSSNNKKDSIFSTFKVYMCDNIRDETHKKSLNIVQFQTPPFSIYIQNSSIPLTLDAQFQMNPPLQMITNQLQDNIIKGWLYVIRSFFQVNFRIQYQLVNFVWLSFDLFLFSWNHTTYFFEAFILFCVQLSKNIKKCLLFIIIHISSTHFAINLLFAQLESVHKLWNNNCNMLVNKWINKGFIYSPIKLHKNLLKWKIKTVLKWIKSEYQKTCFKIWNLKFLVIIAKNKTKTKPSCVIFKLTTCFIVQFSPQTT